MKSQHSLARGWSFNRELSLLIKAELIDPGDVQAASLMAIPMHMMMWGIWGSTPHASIEFVRSIAEDLAAWN